MKINLENKISIVTGGTSGIGRSIAVNLAKNGATVIPISRSTEKVNSVAKEIKKFGGLVIPFSSDVSKKDEVLRINEMLADNKLKVDIIINCAGITIKKEILELSEEEWEEVININLKSIFLIAKYLGPLIIKQAKDTGSFSKFITIGSVGSFQGIPLSSAYCSSKGGVLQLTKVMAIEWAKYKVNVNAIIPGYILTPLSSSILKNQDTYKKVLSRIPLNKIGDVGDVSNLCLFLVSQFSNYITGAAINVDGGLISAAYTYQS